MSEFSLQDVLVLESEDEEGDPCEPLQRAINSGMWLMQGSYGQSMMGAIESGRCLLGKSGARDYWGNYIPSRDQVQPGSTGSYGFVAKRSGRAHADLMAAL